MFNNNLFLYNVSDVFFRKMMQKIMQLPRDSWQTYASSLKLDKYMSCVLLRKIYQIFSRCPPGKMWYRITARKNKDEWILEKKKKLPVITISCFILFSKKYFQWKMSHTVLEIFPIYYWIECSLIQLVVVSIIIYYLLYLKLFTFFFFHKKIFRLP